MGFDIHVRKVIPLFGLIQFFPSDHASPLPMVQDQVWWQDIDAERCDRRRVLFRKGVEPSISWHVEAVTYVAPTILHPSPIDRAASMCASLTLRCFWMIGLLSNGVINFRGFLECTGGRFAGRYLLLVIVIKNLFMGNILPQPKKFKAAEWRDSSRLHDEVFKRHASFAQCSEKCWLWAVIMIIMHDAGGWPCGCAEAIALYGQMRMCVRNLERMYVFN